MEENRSSIATHAIPGPENVERTTLANGLTLLVRENRSAPVIVLDGLLATGSIHDPPGRAGLASLAATLVTHGNEAYDFDHFNEVIESVGASLSVDADSHVTGFELSCLREDFGALVAVLAETLRRPTFPAEQLAIVQGQLAVDFQERLHDTQRLAGLRFAETLYGNHPYGRALSGYPETVAGITPTDLHAFHASHFTPQNGIIVLSGDFEAETIIEQMADLFGAWRGPAPVPGIGAPAKIPGGLRIDIEIADKSQADIIIGARAVERGHPDFYALRVANTILGRFGTMGRLGESVRERQGLAYYCYSTQDADLVAGSWYAAAGVNPVHVERATASILHEFERLANEPIPTDELKDSQDYMTGILPLALETNAGVASTLLNMELYGLGLDYLLRYRDLIYSITPADVARVAQTYLRADDCVTVVAGPGG